MSSPYLVLSDLHCHGWSAFSRVESNGMNSRLRIIIAEIDRAVGELKKAGGDTCVLAGDLFHERGKIHPEVFNPVYDCFKRHHDDGLFIYAIPGNHDLAGKETTELGNAIQTLSAMPNFTVLTKPTVIERMAFVPWCGTKDGLRATVQELADSMNLSARSETDLFIHAGIDGVLIGVPDHGLTAAECAAWGFRRVFAGDYHNHKIMEGGKVISIGATTHQSWNDVGTKAGFLLVTDDAVRFHASHAPAFVEITGDTPEEDVAPTVEGNYVRLRGVELTHAEVIETRKDLERLGARGVLIQATPKKPATGRTGAVAKSATLEASVAAYVDEQKLDHAAAVQRACADVLSAARARRA